MQKPDRTLHGTRRPVGAGGSSLGSQLHSSNNPPNCPGSSTPPSEEVSRVLGPTIPASYRIFPAVRRPRPSTLTLTLPQGPRAFDPCDQSFLESLPLSTCSLSEP